MFHEQLVVHGTFAKEQRIDQHVLGQRPPIAMQRLAQIAQRAGLGLADLLQHLAADRVVQLGPVSREPDRLVGHGLPIGGRGRGRRFAQPLFGLLQCDLHMTKHELQCRGLRHLDQRHCALLLGAMNHRLDHLAIGALELLHIRRFRAALPAPELILQKAVDETHRRVRKRGAQPHVHVYVVDAPREFLEIEIDGSSRLERNARIGRRDASPQKNEESPKDFCQQSDHADRRTAFTTRCRWYLSTARLCSASVDENWCVPSFRETK